MASAPDTPSSDYDAMKPYWDMVDTILAGTQAMRKAPQYLPQFPKETTKDYEYRLENAKFTGVYADIVDDLAARPFAEPLKLADSASPRVKALVQDIDGRGNNLHVFAHSTFRSGIARALDWILVDYTRAKPRKDGLPLTREDELQQGLRPYFVKVPAKSVVAAYSATINGQEVPVHVRISETVTRRDGFDEVTVERIRIMNRPEILDGDGQVIGYGPATFEVQEKDGRTNSWSTVASGPISIGVIPIVPYVVGERETNSWKISPAMRHAADLQIEMYQQETALKSISEMTAFPMLAGNGVAQPMVDGQPVAVPVGPKSVLFAPPYGDNGQHGEWKFIEPSSESLRFLAGQVEATEKQLRELGRQPLTAQSGNLTVVTTAFAAQKGNSAVQNWALGLQDAFNQALVFTAMWLKEPVESAATVTVFTDFAIDMQDDKGPSTLMEMRKNGDLSQETLWAEMGRRNILSAEFNPEAEAEKIAAETPDEDTREGIEGAMPPKALAA